METIKAAIDRSKEKHIMETIKAAIDSGMINISGLTEFVYKMIVSKISNDLVHDLAGKMPQGRSFSEQEIKVAISNVCRQYKNMLNVDGIIESAINKKK